MVNFTLHGFPLNFLIEPTQKYQITDRPSQLTPWTPNPGNNLGQFSGHG